MSVVSEWPGGAYFTAGIKSQQDPGKNFSLTKSALNIFKPVMP